MKREKDVTEKKIRFITLKPWLRIFTCGFSILVFSVNAASIKTGLYSIPIMTASLLFLFAGLYENTWEFDLTKRRAVRKTGLIFLTKKRIINFSAIYKINTETFSLPMRRDSYTEITMYLSDGEKVIIEKDKTHNLQMQLEGLAEVRRLIKAGGK